MDIKRAETMARDLMGFHGLAGWRLVWDKAITRNGQCRYRRQEIGLSRRIMELAAEEGFINTLTHEIAHALLGPGYGHSSTWRTMARAIGCDGSTCTSLVDYQRLARHCYACADCGWKYHCVRRLRNAGYRFHKPCRLKGLTGALREVAQ